MISVIISVYNIAPYLERCVYSILRQTYSDLEIILVDDGSTDESGRICDKLGKLDSRIVVVHKDNGGNASARNAGIDVSKGDFITFVDGDDYIENNMYEEMLAEMSKDDISIVCCGMIVTDISGKDTVQMSKERKVYSREEALYDFFTREGNVKPSACNKLFRRNLFDIGNRFNNDVIHEDTEAMPRFLDATENVVVMDKAFYHYVKRKNSARTTKYFNIRGYHMLDSMKEYENMCKMKYPEILPYFHYYELVTTYEMLLDLARCIDYKKYRRQEFSLRFRTLKAIVKYMRWKEIRKENINQTKVMLVKAVLGVHLAAFIFHLN